MTTQDFNLLAALKIIVDFSLQKEPYKRLALERRFIALYVFVTNKRTGTLRDILGVTDVTDANAPLDLRLGLTVFTIISDDCSNLWSKGLDAFLKQLHIHISETVKPKYSGLSDLNLSKEFLDLGLEKTRFLVTDWGVIGIDGFTGLILPRLYILPDGTVVHPIGLRFDRKHVSYFNSELHICDNLTKFIRKRINDKVVTRLLRKLNILTLSSEDSLTVFNAIFDSNSGYSMTHVLLPNYGESLSAAITDGGKKCEAFEHMGKHFDIQVKHFDFGNICFAIQETGVCLMPNLTTTRSNTRLGDMFAGGLHFLKNAHQENEVASFHICVSTISKLDKCKNSIARLANLTTIIE